MATDDDKTDDKSDPKKPDADKVFNRPEDKAGKQALEEERRARRDAEKTANDLKAELKKFEDRDQSDGEKLADRVTAAEKRADEADARSLRLEVAHAKGLTPVQSKRLVGDTKEELERDADEILEAFGGKPAGEADDGKEAKDGPPSPRPKPNLSGGSDPAGSEPDETDPRKLASMIPRA